MNQSTRVVSHCKFHTQVSSSFPVEKIIELNGYFECSTCYHLVGHGHQSVSARRNGKSEVVHQRNVATGSKINLQTLSSLAARVQLIFACLDAGVLSVHLHLIVRLHVKAQVQPMLKTCIISETRVAYSG
jgi:hypothetical protein